MPWTETRASPATSSTASRRVMGRTSSTSTPTPGICLSYHHSTMSPRSHTGVPGSGWSSSLHKKKLFCQGYIIRMRKMVDDFRFGVNFPHLGSISLSRYSYHIDQQCIAKNYFSWKCRLDIALPKEFSITLGL